MAEISKSLRIAYEVQNTECYPDFVRSLRIVMATRGDCTMESLTSDATQQSLTRTLLQDHSQRLEQHKNNFDILQREYLKLQQVKECPISIYSLSLVQMYDKAKEDQAEANENYAHLVTKSEEIIRQLQQERDDKITECEHLRHQVSERERRKRNNIVGRGIKLMVKF